MIVQVLSECQKYAKNVGWGKSLDDIIEATFFIH